MASPKMDVESLTHPIRCNRHTGSLQIAGSAIDKTVSRASAFIGGPQPGGRDTDLDVTLPVAHTHLLS